MNVRDERCGCVYDDAVMSTIHPHYPIGAGPGSFCKRCDLFRPCLCDKKEHTMKPTIGRIVIYRSRTGNYDVPAIVTATVETLNPDGVAAGHVPDLTSDQHVHLTVLTPGTPGLRAGAEDFLVESEHGRSENVAGCYQEWDVACGGLPPSDKIVAGWRATPRPGTWRWPERA